MTTATPDRATFCVLCLSGQHDPSVHETPGPAIFCEICDQAVPEDECVDCAEVGRVHVDCHRGSACSDPLCDPFYEEN